MSSQPDDSTAPAAIMFRRGAGTMALRGIIAILLGVMVLMRPARTLAVFVAFLALYLTVDGILTLASAFRAAAGERKWWPYMVEGLLSLAVGLIGLARPGGLALMVLALFAVRAIVVGLVEMGTAVSVGRVQHGAGWLLGLAGLISLAFGLLLLARPAFMLVTGAWIFGTYAIAFGLFLEVEAAHTRNVARSLTAVHEAP